jgi:hypothetical protein
MSDTAVAHGVLGVYLLYVGSVLILSLARRGGDPQDTERLADLMRPSRALWRGRRSEDRDTED